MSAEDHKRMVDDAQRKLMHTQKILKEKDEEVRKLVEDQIRSQSNAGKDVELLK